MNEYQTQAHQLLDLGFNVTAILAGEKRPAHTWQQWHATKQTLNDVNALPWRDAGGVGVVCGVGGLRIFDFDKCPSDEPPCTVLRVLNLPDSYPWWWRSGSGNGWGLAVLCFKNIPAGVLAVNGNGPGVFEARGNGFDHLELRFERCQTVLPPSTHPTGPGYKWATGAPTEAPATVTASQIIAAFQAVTLRAEPKPTHAPTPTNGHGSGYAAVALRDELEHLGRAIEGTRNDTLNTCAFNLGQLVAGGELDRCVVERDLLAVALRIGLTEPEAEATIKSGLDAGAREPRTVPIRPAIPSTYRPAPDEPPAWLDAPDWLPADELAASPTPAPDLSECPSLPEGARLDPELGRDASPWLDAYVEFSRRWAPRAYDGFHEAVGLWVLSTVAARRVKLDLGGERYPSLYLANIARSSVWTKSTAHHIGAALLDVCGLAFLLAPDDATPQALLASMSTPTTVTDWHAKPPDERERAALALAFAGQKGWSYDEFGSKVAAMMRDSGPMADFRGILRRFDEANPKYVYATIARGENQLQRPYLALLASLTPADMAPHAKRGGALWNDGFWARFAFVAPAPEDQPTMGRFPDGTRSFPPDLLQPLRSWHDRLGAPAVTVAQRKDAKGEPTRDFDVTVTAHAPEVCALGAGVCDAFYCYHDALTSVVAASDNTDLDGNYSRFAEKALRVAILLASIENQGVIELRHWARAQEIAERWRLNLHNLYRTLNEKQDEEGTKQERVLEIVKRLGVATPTDVHRDARHIATVQAGDLMRQLCHAGALMPAKTTRKGTVAYQLAESCRF